MSGPWRNRWRTRSAASSGNYAETVCPPLVEEEYQAAAAAQMFNAAGVDLIVAVEVAYTKGLVPTRCFLDTTAPVLVWNTQQIEFLPEDADFDLIMLNSGMAGVPEMTSALLRMGRPFWMVTSLMDDPAGQKKLGRVHCRGRRYRGGLKTARIAILGHAFEGMTDLMIDQLSLRQFVGPVCWPVEPEKVSVAMGEISEADLKALVAKESGSLHDRHGCRPVRALLPAGAGLGKGDPRRQVRRHGFLRPGLADRPPRRHHSRLRHRAAVRDRLALLDRSGYHHGGRHADAPGAGRQSHLPGKLRHRFQAGRDDPVARWTRQSRPGRQARGRHDQAQHLLSRA